MATPLSVVSTSLTRLLFVNSVGHLGNYFQFGDEKRADSKLTIRQLSRESFEFFPMDYSDECY